VKRRPNIKEILTHGGKNTISSAQEKLVNIEMLLHNEYLKEKKEKRFCGY
jgi:hypothetical protein